MSKHHYLRLRHRASGHSALGVRRADGLVLVQFDHLDHPQASRWHLYPRHHFHRRKGLPTVKSFPDPPQPELAPEPPPPFQVGNQAGYNP